MEERSSSKLNDRFVVVALLFLLIVKNSFLFGEALFFSVSPFDTSYGLSLKRELEFWKFDISLDLRVDIALRNGFPQANPNTSEAIRYFKFESYPYFALYGAPADRVPVTTFVNPIERTWALTWLNAGYIGKYLLYNGGNVWVLGDGDNLNAGARIFGVDLFFERNGAGFLVGAGRYIYGFAGSSYGLIASATLGENFALHLMVQQNGGPTPTLSYGFRAKTKWVDLHIWSKDNGEHAGDVTWKVGDAYVVGRFKGKTVSIVLEFPVW